jgi:integrase
MPSVSVFKRKRKGKRDKIYTAQIRFGEKHGGASYLRSTGVADKREAEAIARRIAREIEEKELPRRGVEVLTLDIMFSRWIDERGQELRSGKDIKWQIEMLLRLMGGVKIVSEIGNKDVHNFVQDAKAGGAGPVPINRCLGRLRATMNYAVEMWEQEIRIISWRKMMQEEAGVREIYLSPEEARRLMELLPNHIALAFAFSLYTGVRLDELETLAWERIDFERAAATVITKGRGQKIKTRTAWLSQKALRILSKLLAGSTETGPVFDLTNRRKHWEAARAAIGRPDVTWHDLRGMTATWSRQFAGADMRLISATLGHSDTKVTERYARVIDREIVTMLDKLPDISPQSQEQKQLSRMPSIDGSR